MAETRTNNSPGAESLWYRRVKPRWDLVRALNGGTLAMREGSTRWLPKFPEESNAHYGKRLNQSFLMNGYRSTANRVVSKPFSKDVTVDGTESLPVSMQSMHENVDLQGTNITQFGRRFMRDAVDYGLSYIITTKNPRGEGSATEQTDALNGVRPYFIHVPATAGIAARLETEGGVRVVTQFRYRDFRTIRDGEFGEKIVEHVTVWEPDRYAEYQRDAEASDMPGMVAANPEEDEYKLVEGSERRNPLGAVPVSVLYTNYLGEFRAAPALEDLAWTNLQHWQSRSDQNNILSIARVPMLHWAGWEDTGDSAKKQQVIAPNRILKSRDPNAKVSWTEIQGGSVEAGRQDLKDIEAWMEFLGAAPFVARSGSMTATGQAIDESRAHTDVLAWIRGVELALEDAYTWALQWEQTNPTVRPELPDGFSVNVFSEFSHGVKAIDEVRSLFEMWRNGAITQETLLREVQRRGILSDNLEVEEEIEAAREEDDPSGGADPAPPDETQFEPDPVNLENLRT